MVILDGVTKRYGEAYAVRDISFEMETGKIYGLLGPNGAGKSTTMNILTGYIGATEGSALIGGHDIFDEAKKAKALLGYLPEVPPLYPEMTVREYLLFVAELKGEKKTERKASVETVMEKTGLSEEKDRLIRKLSKGYKQRVGFAQALLGNPKVLILDEPTAGLDPLQIKEFNELLLSLRDAHAILLSSHILSEVAAVCDHVFMIAEGTLVYDGEISEDTDLEALFMEKVLHGQVTAVDAGEIRVDTDQDTAADADETEAEETADVTDAEETAGEADADDTTDEAGADGAEEREVTEDGGDL